MGNRTITRVVGIGIVAGLLVFGVSSMASAADPGYPGSTTPTTAPPATTATSGVVPVAPGGTVDIPIGGTTTVSVAGFEPDTPVSVTVDGVAVTLTLTTDASGDLIVTFQITDPHISVNGSVPIPATVGNNPITLTGTGPDGTPVTQTFNVDIPSATTTAAGTTSGTASGSLAFTGADIAATVVGGLALLAIGTLLVIFTRRRAGAQRPA